MLNQQSGYLPTDNSPTRNNYSEDVLKNEAGLFFKTAVQQRDSSLVRPNNLTMWDVLALKDTHNKKLEDEEHLRQQHENKLKMREHFESQIRERERQRQEEHEALIREQEEIRAKCQAENMKASQEGFMRFT